MSTTKTAPTKKKPSAMNDSGDGYSRICVPAVKRSPNIAEVLNAECIRIATTTDFPEALNPNAITTERPVTMDRKIIGVAVVHPGMRNSGQCHADHMTATTIAAIHGGNDSCNLA
ncbi:MAG TPA: hypothetical protein VK828_09245 [Terriglobales bacterium]|nr:hypothetical protein [Terriglobales bacterium]